MKNHNRILWLDVARVFAIISISLNHAVNRTYDNYTNTQLEFLNSSTISMLFKTVISVFSRLGVPIFLMISGYLLLNKKMEDEADVKKFYKHNWLGLLITSEIWYFITFWFLVLLQPGNTTLETYGIAKTAIKSVLSMMFINQQTLGSMWYIPMILCVYMVIPIFAIAFNKISYKAFRLPMVTALILGMVIPNINAFFTMAQINHQFYMELKLGSLFSLYMLYVFAGYFVGKKGLLSRIPTWLIGFGALLVFVLDCMYQYWAYAGPTNYLVSYDFIGIIICATLLFEFIRRVSDKLAPIGKAMAYISKISFGIYFVHIIIMELLNWYWSFEGFNRFEKLIFLELVSIVGSVIIITILSKVKVLKKYMFLIKD